jgi:hypothetical protein
LLSNSIVAGRLDRRPLKHGSAASAAPCEVHIRMYRLSGLRAISGR